MTIYNKPRAEVFASNAPPSEIRPFDAWLRGLGIAFDETNGFPEMESFNGLLQSLSIYIKYLEQRGLAEWRNDLEYPVGAGVQVGLSWFKAKRQNLNKPPATSQGDWELLVNASALSYVEPLYIENNVVKIRDATKTQKGVSRFATDAEAQAGAKVSAAITPDQAMLTSFGVGQSWVDVTSERALGRQNIYTNNTSKPILVVISLLGLLTVSVDGIEVSTAGKGWADDNLFASITVVVPVGSKYSVSSYNMKSGTLTWTELR